MRNRGRIFVRSGMTLIELLVVIVILGILAGFMIPRIPGMVQGQRLREASRAVQVAISTARGRAMELRRPCGIRIENQPGSTLLRVVETKQPFSGFTEGSTADVVSSNQLAFQEGLPKYVQKGDRLWVDGRRSDPEMTIGDIDATNLPVVVTVNHPSPQLASAIGARVRYLIMPNPSSKLTGSTRRPVVLPAQTTIDLGWSGNDNGSWDADPLRWQVPGDKAVDGGYMDDDTQTIMTSPTPDAVTILFEPDGAISSVIREYPETAGASRSVDSRSSTPGRMVWIMIGRPDQVDSEIATQGIQVLSDAKSGLANDIDKTNLADGDCRWLAISARNGRVVTEMNLPQGNGEFIGYRAAYIADGGDPDKADGAARNQCVKNSRNLARGGENVGGNQ